MSNEMNNIPVKDSKGNVIGTSSVNEEESLINDLLSVLSMGSLNIKSAEPFVGQGQRTLGTEVTPQEARELSRWIKQNYPTGKDLPSPREAAKILEKYIKIDGKMRKIPIKDPSKPGYQPKITPKDFRASKLGEAISKYAVMEKGTPVYDRAQTAAKQLSSDAKSILSGLTQKSIPGRGAIAPGMGIIGALLAAKPEIENILQDMLGLNETEVWRNPDRYGSGESYDPYMDPNNPIYDLQVPIEDMVKPIPFNNANNVLRELGLNPYDK
jgi:hypothetical protein